MRLGSLVHHLLGLSTVFFFFFYLHSFALLPLLPIIRKNMTAIVNRFDAAADRIRDDESLTFFLSCTLKLVTIYGYAL